MGISYEDFKKLYKSDHVTLVEWRYVADWKMYADETDPSTVAVMEMTKNTWDMIDVTLLRLNYELSKTSIGNTKPTVTTSTVTSNQIEAVSFLKYCNVKLIDKSQILKFYDDIVTQESGYNVFDRPSDELSLSYGIEPDSMTHNCKSEIAIALQWKCSQTDIIATSYADAYNILATTTNGYVFLQLLVNQVHPLLEVKNISTIDIPKFSKFNNLFRYAREIKY